MQCKTISGEVDISQNESCCIKICFNKGIGNSLIDPQEFVTVLNSMEMIVKNGLRFPIVYGDFKKPFMTLAERCALGSKTKVNNGQGITFCLNAYSVSITNETASNCLKILFEKENQR